MSDADDEVRRCQKCLELYWVGDWRADDDCPYCNPPEPPIRDELEKAK